MIYLPIILIAMTTINLNKTFNFNQLESNQMMIVNDSVMGGESISKYTINNKTITFMGDVSLRNNGGFASIRMLWPFEETNGLNKIKLKLKGDGKTYQFRLRTNRGFDGAAYVYEFKTIKDESIIVEIDLVQFIPSYRGRTLTNMPKLAFKDVKQMGLLIAEKQTGKFSIQLESIAVF
jgi:monofunctional biosynthetic peptidoglycan transglycosylase